MNKMHTVLLRVFSGIDESFCNAELDSKDGPFWVCAVVLAHWNLSSSGLQAG